MIKHRSRVSRGLPDRWCNVCRRLREITGSQRPWSYFRTFYASVLSFSFSLRIIITMSQERFRVFGVYFSSNSEVLFGVYFFLPIRSFSVFIFGVRQKNRRLWGFMSKEIVQRYRIPQPSRNIQVVEKHPRTDNTRKTK